MGMHIPNKNLAFVQSLDKCKEIVKNELETKYVVFWGVVDKYKNNIIMRLTTSRTCLKFHVHH